jgi:hypothetical protein
MLRPRTYPELLGKALVLEAQPFETMVDDDEPWVEGLVLIISLGVLIGVARLLGGLLLAASLPPANTVLAVLLNGWQEFVGRMDVTADVAATEANLRQAWSTFTWLTGYGAGWARLLTLIATPLGLVLQWLLASLLVYGVARALGGSGTLNQTLGAAALMVAPNVLLLLTAVPFVSVSALLLSAWGLLILYRAVEVAHNLPWPKALLAAAAPLILLILLLVLAGLLAGFGLWIGGMA